ncbi:MAG: FAD-binding oxidoreductase [Gemmatimonadaceae bacterium]|nr:FAD-binding oxidoreductase [Gemmatimonadaceae bacterium]
MSIDRRDFIKQAGAQTGLLLTGTGSLGATIVPSSGVAPALQKGLPDVVVIGAGAIGGWTALHLNAMGAKVLLVDAYGPGNSRSTSGDVTRGVRTSYGDRPNGEQWMLWANTAITRWREWDEIFWKELGARVYFTTGDLITRAQWEPFLTQTREWWVKNGIGHETLTVDEARYRWPVFDLQGINAIIYEPQAGVVRARRSCELVASWFQKHGGTLRIDRISTLMRGTGQIDQLLTSDGSSIRGGQYVFACGPWLPKVFANLLGPRMRSPMGNVFYMATPIGDKRFQAPDMPSHNFPGITGWAALAVDNHGFRTRIGGGQAGDPDTSERMVGAPNVARLRTFLAERFPLLKDMPINEQRACHYETTVSRNFIIDKHPDFSNVWIAGGGNAEAFKQGPVFGEYTARRVLGKPTDPALTEAFRVPTTTYEEEAAKAEAAAQQGARRPPGSNNYQEENFDA